MGRRQDKLLLWYLVTGDKRTQEIQWFPEIFLVNPVFTNPRRQTESIWQAPQKGNIYIPFPGTLSTCAEGIARLGLMMFWVILYWGQSCALWNA